MSDKLTITIDPRYVSAYRKLTPGNSCRLEHFNGERRITAVRGRKSLSVVTKKLNPARPLTLTRVMENYGTEKNPLLVKVRAELSGPKGDLIVYFEQAEHQEEGIRAVFFLDGLKNLVENRKYKSFSHMKKDPAAMKLLKKILNLKHL